MAGRNWTNNPVRGSMGSCFLWTRPDWFEHHRTWSDFSRIQEQKMYWSCGQYEPSSERDNPGNPMFYVDSVNYWPDKLIVPVTGIIQFELTANMPYNYGHTFSFSPDGTVTGSVLRRPYELSTQVRQSALKGIHHTLYTSAPDTSGLGLPRLGWILIWTVELNNLWAYHRLRAYSLILWLPWSFVLIQLGLGPCLTQAIWNLKHMQTNSWRINQWIGDIEGVVDSNYGFLNPWWGF